MNISNTQVALADRAADQHEARHNVAISLVGAQDTHRCEVERFIKRLFRRAYGARIKHFPPYLLSMRQDDRLLAALGIRAASSGSLFLERYLDRPIESTLARVFHCPTDRDRIVEVGSLVSGHAGGARALITTLTAYLSGAGYEWVVFTATPTVRNNFVRLGIELTPLVKADKTRLGDEQHEWGSYYETDPVVVVCNVQQGVVAVLEALLKERLFPAAQQLWDDASHAGRLGELWQPPRTLGTQWPAWMLSDETQTTRHYTVNGT